MSLVVPVIKKETRHSVGTERCDPTGECTEDHEKRLDKLKNIARANNIKLKVINENKPPMRCSTVNDLKTHFKIA